MNFVEILGNIAAFLTTISFLPQAVKTIRTRDTSSLSLPMYLLFFTGVLFWVAYGFLINSSALVVGNTITALLAGIILWFKLQEIWKK